MASSSLQIPRRSQRASTEYGSLMDGNQRPPNSLSAMAASSAGIQSSKGQHCRYGFSIRLQQHDDFGHLPPALGTWIHKRGLCRRQQRPLGKRGHAARRAMHPTMPVLQSKKQLGRRSDLRGTKKTQPAFVSCCTESATEHVQDKRMHTDLN